MECVDHLILWDPGSSYQSSNDFLNVLWSFCQPNCRISNTCVLVQAYMRFPFVFQIGKLYSFEHKSFDLIHMASLTDIIAEMSDVADLLKSKASAQTKETSVQAVANKIAVLSFMDVGAAVRLHNANEAHAMLEHFAASIQTAIDARLEKGAALHLQSSPRNKKEQQLLVSVLAYLSEEDWAKLQRPTIDPDVMIEVIAARYARLGVQHLDEQTAKWAIAVVLYLYKAQNAGTMPLYHVIHDWVLKFKSKITAFKAPWDFDVVVQYPASPDALSSAIMAHAYSDGDPPVAKTIPGFSHLGEHVPLRSNSALLTREKALMQAHSQLGTPMQHLNMASLQARQAYALQQQMHHKPMHHMIGMVYHQHSQPLLAMTDGAASHVVRPAAQDQCHLLQPLPDINDRQIVVAQHTPSVATSPVVVESAGASGCFGRPRIAATMPDAKPDAQREPSEVDYDQEAFDALKLRHRSKKPAAAVVNDADDERSSDCAADDACNEDEGDETAATPKANTTKVATLHKEAKVMKVQLMKKPSCAAAVAPLKRSASSPSLKRPASHMPPPLQRSASQMAKKVFQLSDLKVKLTYDEMKHTTLKNLSSAWYHRVKTTLMRNGVKKEHASQAARDAHSKVATLWHSMAANVMKKPSKR